MHNPRPNEIYKHFKGNLYQVITPAVHSETGEEMVVYQALYGDYRVYVRPLSLFTGPVDRAKYPDAQQEYRFEPVSRLVAQQSPHAAADSLIKQSEPGRQEAFSIRSEAERQQEKAQAEQEIKAAEVRLQPQQGQEPADIQIDPFVMEFLESETYGEKLNILAALHARVTDDMINTMAIAMDVEIHEGDIQERYEQLRSCLLTLDKYERSRPLG